MQNRCELIHAIKEELLPYGASLIAVSKTKPANDIEEVYKCGHHLFGENYVQELTQKYDALPHDIQWHFIGHLQTNKVKYIAPFITLIHSVDSIELLEAINKRGLHLKKVIDCLLQVYIAREETKFGFDTAELHEIMIKYTTHNYTNIRLRGFMGMATNTADMRVVRTEYEGLKKLFDEYVKTRNAINDFDTLSMGMTGDYKIALECGSTMVRIGSKIFGNRS